MTYEAWRCTFQSAEAAARAAYGQVQGAVAEAAGLREKLEARCPGLVQIQEPAPRSKVLAAILAARGALQHLKEGGKHSEILFKEALQAIDSVVAPIESTQAAPAQPAEGVPAPVLYVSKEQLNNHRDHADSEAGRYLPCRITPAGKFTTPLYAAPQAQAEDARDAVKRGEVLVTVSGYTSSGKSAIAGEIEIMCRALGLQVEWPDSDSEKHMTHADWIAALEQYKPRVRIVERNVPHSVVKDQDK